MWCFIGGWFGLWFGAGGGWEFDVRGWRGAEQFDVAAETHLIEEMIEQTPQRINIPHKRIIQHLLPLPYPSLLSLPSFPFPFPFPPQLRQHPPLLTPSPPPPSPLHLPPLLLRTETDRMSEIDIVIFDGWGAGEPREMREGVFGDTVCGVHVEGAVETLGEERSGVH